VFFRRAAASARETSFLTRPGKASIIGGSRVFLVSALVFLPLLNVLRGMISATTMTTTTTTTGFEILGRRFGVRTRLANVCEDFR
jgi:hypothetical protein